MKSFSMFKSWQKIPLTLYKRHVDTSCHDNATTYSTDGMSRRITCNATCLLQVDLGLKTTRCDVALIFRPSFLLQVLHAKNIIMLLCGPRFLLFFLIFISNFTNKCKDHQVFLGSRHHGGIIKQKSTWGVLSNSLKNLSDWISHAFLNARF